MFFLKKKQSESYIHLSFVVCSLINFLHFYPTKAWHYHEQVQSRIFPSVQWSVWGVRGTAGCLPDTQQLTVAPRDTGRMMQGSRNLPRFWGDQTMEMYGNFEGFPHERCQVFSPDAPTKRPPWWFHVLQILTRFATSATISTAQWQLPPIENRDCKQIKNSKPFLFPKLIICKYCYSTNPSNLYFCVGIFSNQKRVMENFQISGLETLEFFDLAGNPRWVFFVDVLFFIKGRWVNEAGRMVLPLVISWYLPLFATNPII